MRVVTSVEAIPVAVRLVSVVVVAPVVLCDWLVAPTVLSVVLRVGSVVLATVL
jgi:hypothetical protein